MRISKGVDDQILKLIRHRITPSVRVVRQKVSDMKCDIGIEERELSRNSGQDVEVTIAFFVVSREEERRA